MDVARRTTGAGDGRAPAAELITAYRTLEPHGWIAETVAVSSGERDGAFLELPVLSFRTAEMGRAVWILSGIHGEEPAGPNAIAAGIGHIRELGGRMPVVLLPLCNPLGYAAGWRYLNRRDWAAGAHICSVGDSEHVLPDLQNPAQPRAQAASSGEAAALAAHVLKLAQDYPPALTIDFHEDDLLDEGYIYAQGRGPEAAVARRVVGILSSSGIPIRLSGETRFGEKIAGGVVGPEKDGSIDELLSAETVIIDGKPLPGPRATASLVVETPAGAMPLGKRRAAHLAVIRHLDEIAAEVF